MTMTARARLIAYLQQTGLSTARAEANVDAFAHELAERIRRERDDADVPGSPATPQIIRGMSHAADLIDPVEQ